MPTEAAEKFVQWYPGQRVGRYTLVQPIGAGGMAEVWLAYIEGAHGFQKPIALKRLNLATSGERRFIDMFLDEAQLVSRLTHPGIAQVLELGEIAGALYVAMEYLAGETLVSINRVARTGELLLSFEVALKITCDTAEALHYAHTRRDELGAPLAVVHRDVSPQNLMVTYEGITKVLDFGIAKAAQRRSVTETGEMRGKLAYMAPEQARGEPVDARADQFALGVVLFELATGTRLYPGKPNEWDLLRLVAEGQGALPTARERSDAVPEALSQIIARAMSRKAEDRYESVEAFRLALTGWLDVTGAKLPTSEQLSQLMHKLFASQIENQKTLVLRIKEGQTKPSAPAFGSRSKALRAVLLAATGAAVTGGAFFLWQRAQPQRPPPPPLPVAVVTEPPPEPVADAGPALVAEPPLPQPPAAAPVKKHEKPKGKLTLRTKPWTEVFLGTRRLGETPFADLPLPAGIHQLKLVNTQKGISTVISVEITAGQTTTRTLNL